MYIEKKEDLSLHYWLVDLFQDAPFITHVDEFPEELLNIPTIASDVGRIDMEDFELGDRTGLRVRNWYIDVFAKTKTQREDFGYRILDALKDGINVYDYDEGFPPDVTPSKIGHLNVLARSYEPMGVSPDFTDKLYYRTTISFVAVNDKL